NRVDGIAPAAPQDIDILHRIGSRTQRPQQFVTVPDVDIFVHHYDVTGQERSRAALRRDQRRLPRVAGIALLDRHDHQQTRLIVGDSPYIRDAAFVQVTPYVGRADKIV